MDFNDYQYVFSDKKVGGFNKINYIYGKNGTGKSSLVKAIKEQYENQYDLHIFQGFNSIIGTDDELNAIALGSENTEITKQISEVNNKIKEIESSIYASENHPDNLFAQIQHLKNNYFNKSRSLKTDLTSIARDLKTNKSSIVGVVYSITNLKKDIGESYELDDDELNQNLKIFNSKEIKLSRTDLINLPELKNLSNLLKSTNDIISTSVTPSKIIEDLNNNSERRNFAQKGMEIHKRDENEICAFCGNKISGQRWNLLDSYFSKEVEILKNKVENNIRIINYDKKLLNSKIELNGSKYHQIFQDECKNIEIAINSKRNDLLDFFNELLAYLEKKREDIFMVEDKIDIDTPDDFSSIQEKLNELFSKNKKFNDDLVNEKNKAKRKLKCHYINEKLIEYKYNEQNKRILSLDVEIKELQEKINKNNKILENLQASRNTLIESSKNETQAADNINKLIGSLGDDSFKLEHVLIENNQKGLYRIKDRNGKERSLKSLSTGEKNIVSFLWFMYHLYDVDDENNKEKVVLFDDPVNSNDDSSQYLIMGEIQELISQENKPQIFILTHNNHFFLQIKPTSFSGNKGKKKRVGFRLRRNGRTSISKIGNGEGYDNDVKPIYQNLWDELHFAYDNDKLIFMWNDMRRILETFGRFNYNNKSPRDTVKHTGNAENKVLYLALLDSLNVNSHVGYETDLDLSDKNKDQLLNAFKNVFDCLGAKTHFETYWK